jgi:hypothetical protein
MTTTQLEEINDTLAALSTSLGVDLPNGDLDDLTHFVAAFLDARRD